MIRHKLTPALALVVLLVSLPNSSSAHAWDAADGSVVGITDAQRAFLSRIARRTVRDAVLNRSDYVPPYAPAALKEMTGEAIVRLRLDGYLLAQTSVGPGPLALVTRDAALASAKSIASDKKISLDMANNLLIEIEVVGPLESIPQIADWTKPGALGSFVEPGVHGLALNGAGLHFRFCPTEVITSDRPLSDALAAVAKASLSGPDALAKVRLSRFRTDHWYQRAGGAKPVSLSRGLLMVRPDQVTRSGLTAAITKLADYMEYRQLDSGLFTYQYEPGEDRYSDDDSPIHQVGACVALSVHSRGGRRSSRDAADRAIRYHLQGMTDLPDARNAAFIATADGKNRLGLTALFCLALGTHPNVDEYGDVRQKLVNGMLWLQRPSGMFLTAFPPARAVEGQDHFPGEALLSLAVHYAHSPSSRILEAFDRAVGFYRGYFKDRPNLSFVPWQLQAFAAMAKHTKRKDFVDFAFELADWIVARQIDRENCPWPDQYGGIATRRSGFADFTTGVQLEALVDALALARAEGDADRITDYERAVRGAARFVMQLQVRPEEAYYMRSPRDAVGGIRTDLALNLLRIDHCQHALIGLIKARDVLFPGGD